MRVLVFLLLLSGGSLLLYGWLGGGQPYRVIGASLILIGSLPTLKYAVDRMSGQN